ncbi:hypothetical protein R1flu_012103 [Riccia fluitans]|uniref:Uncharacterized protein n=1 Tax=Riccia fluitans TaxID=41844 RepID=A0ABD1Z9P6_9MARC
MLTSRIEVHFRCHVELKLQGRIRNKAVEDKVPNALAYNLPWETSAKHEVKALFMDGYTETDMSKYLRHKHGSVVNDIEHVRQHIVSLNSETSLSEEPEFYFPFVDQEELPIPSMQPVVSMEDIIREVKMFGEKVDGDPF